MKALITGGAGFIGSHLAEELLKRGDEVWAIDNLSTGRKENIKDLLGHPQFNFVLDTIMNEDRMEDLIDHCDIIYHLAAAVGVKYIIDKPLTAIKTNVRGTEIVLELANKEKKKVILASTSEIYGKANDGLFREDDDRTLGCTQKSRWSYSCTKALDEFLALAYWKEFRLPVVIIRFFNICGPRQTGEYGMVIPRFVQQALEGKPITVYGDGQQTRSFTYISDALRGILALAEHPRAVGGVFNLGSEESVTINELAEKIKKLTGSKSRIIHIPYEEAYESGFEDMRHRVPDLTKIRNLVEYRPQVDLETMLKRIIQSFREKEKD